ncbi:MAG TPA: arsenate reductase ArsC [Candidatus Caenarcaniphilales bacterium]|nr:arsenate reductase ArsC [Candidatus Caenarcaniphilales bacterium]
MTGASVSEERRPIRVLFICVHNSARSIMAEALLRDVGGDEFEALSAGTDARVVNPLTLRVLEEAGVSTAGLSSKPVQPFVGEQFDYVITVCDPAREACPFLPGHHSTLHWSFDDPSEAEGTDEERARVFRRVFEEIRQQVGEFVVRRREPAAEGVG